MRSVSRSPGKWMIPARPASPMALVEAADTSAVHGEYLHDGLFPQPAF